jgi:transketolase
MVDFCRFHLPPYFQRCAESEDFEDGDESSEELYEHEDFEGLSPPSPSRMEHRQKVMDQITPQKWKTYFSQWKAEKADKATKEASGELVYIKEKASSGVERMGLTEEDSDRLTDILFNFSSLDFEMAKLKLPAYDQLLPPGQP